MRILGGFDNVSRETPGVAVGGGAGDAGAAGAGGGNPWYAGRAEVTPEIVTHLQTNGLLDKSAVEVAAAMSKAHFEARKFIGVPESQLLRFPKDAADEAGWKSLWTKLGVPTDKTQYDEGLKKIARTDGKPVDAALLDFSRELAAKLHVPASDAPALLQEIMSREDKAVAAQAAERTMKIEQDRDALARAWGTTKEALQTSPNMMIAKNAAAKLAAKTPGLSEAVAAFEGQVGYDKVMNMFLDLGRMMGEDKFITGGGQGQGNGGALTVDQARAQKAELTRDEAWRGRYMKGDREAARQMQALDWIISGATGPRPAFMGG